MIFLIKVLEDQSFNKRLSQLVKKLFSTKG